MNLTKLLSLLRFPAPMEDAICALSEKNCTEISALSEAAYTGTDYEYPIRTYTPLNRLMSLVNLLPQKYTEYQQLGVPEEIITNTFRDVTHRAFLYFQRHGSPGLSEEDVLWFRHIINKEIFQIGPLQYQPFDMVYLDEETLGEPYMTFSPGIKARIPLNTPVINCHIPVGADLSEDRIPSSLSLARQLFQKLYPDTRFVAFLCYSWLLYPDMLSLLSPNSRIRKFAKHFEIIGSCEDQEQAMEFLIPESSLFRKASEHPECFGFACGIADLSAKGEYKGEYKYRWK